LLLQLQICNTEVSLWQYIAMQLPKATHPVPKGNMFIIYMNIISTITKIIMNIIREREREREKLITL